MFLCFQEILCPDGKRCCPEGHLCSTDGRSCVKTGEILFYRQPVYIYLKKNSPKNCVLQSLLLPKLQVSCSRNQARYVNLD